MLFSSTLHSNFCYFRSNKRISSVPKAMHVFMFLILNQNDWIYTKYRYFTQFPRHRLMILISSEVDGEQLLYVYYLLKKTIGKRCLYIFWFQLNSNLDVFRIPSVIFRVILKTPVTGLNTTFTTLSPSYFIILIAEQSP